MCTHKQKTITDTVAIIRIIIMKTGFRETRNKMHNIRAKSLNNGKKKDIKKEESVLSFKLIDYATEVRVSAPAPRTKRTLDKPAVNSSR